MVDASESAFQLCLAKRLSPVSADRLESLLDLFGARPGHLLGDLTVPHKDERRPQFDVEGSSERFALAIFDLEMLNCWELVEPGRQLRPERLAVASPRGAELEEDRTLHLVNLFPSRFAAVMVDHRCGPPAVLLPSQRALLYPWKGGLSWLAFGCGAPDRRPLLCFQGGP